MLLPLHVPGESGGAAAPEAAVATTPAAMRRGKRWWQWWWQWCCCAVPAAAVAAACAGWRWGCCCCQHCCCTCCLLRYRTWTAAMSFFFYSCFTIFSPRHLPSPHMTPDVTTFPSFPPCLHHIHNRSVSRPSFLFRSPFSLFPKSLATSPSFPLPYSSNLHLPTWLLPLLSRTLDSSMLTLLSPTTCTILRLMLVMAGPSQAFPVFNHS